MIRYAQFDEIQNITPKISTENIAALGGKKNAAHRSIIL